jgi:glycosyltransferase involved in cell wall biosynthesis
MSVVRVALLTEIPAPYRLPLFRALAGEEGIELRVLFLGRTDPRRSYPFPEGELGFGYEVLPGASLVRGGRWAVLSRGAVRALRRFAPDVIVVGGWNQPAFWLALLYARTRRRPLVTWVESTLRDARSGSAAGSLAKRAFVRGSSAFLVPGSAAAAYLRSLGVDDSRIVVAPNAVGLGHVVGPGPVHGRSGADAPADEQARGSGQDGSGHGVGPGPVHVLFVGRLAAEKGLDVLFRAIGGLPVRLDVAGTGPDEERLRTSAPENVAFLGHLGHEELGAAYAAADVFVLPSLSEPWGMVLNEAAAAGLPLVATDAVGAAADLIEDGANGFVVPTGDADALRAALATLAANADLRATFGKHSLEIASGFTPQAWALAVAGLARRLAG